MSKRIMRCHKCKGEISVASPVCYKCGAVVVVKTSMLNKKTLKKMKEIS